MRTEAATFFQELQREICAALEHVDGRGRFMSHTWIRPGEGGAPGGGGTSNVLHQGSLFEQAGVNFSEVQGMLAEEMSQVLVGSTRKEPFFACGVSLVLHPGSPFIPTTHANYRYLEVGEKSWFGGGGDLTPYYLFEADAQHFHRTLKLVCDRHDSRYYPQFKRDCDEYFFLPHRKEARGVGGIFFDYLGRDTAVDMRKIFALVRELGKNFLECYVPIVDRRRHLTWTEDEKNFQLIRRGRYVEFNLLYDRGTLFGLKTGGRTESILMSLPPLVRWEYDDQITPSSREAKLLEVLRHPRDWV